MCIIVKGYRERKSKACQDVLVAQYDRSAEEYPCADISEWERLCFHDVDGTDRVVQKTARVGLGDRNFVCNRLLDDPYY